MLQELKYSGYKTTHKNKIKTHPLTHQKSHLMKCRYLTIITILKIIVYRQLRHNHPYHYHHQHLVSFELIHSILL